MGILKGLALWLFSSLLFLSLTIFGLLFTVNGTVLNPDFISDEIENLDVSSLAEGVINEQMAEEDFPEELKAALIDTIDKLEGPVKEQIGAAIHDTYDYLLGKKEKPDFTATLGNTFFNSSFIDSLLADLDLSLLAEEFLSEQMGEGEFQEEFGTVLVDTITENEPEIKAQISAAAGPIFDYLLGETQSIDLAHTLRNTILTPDFVESLIDTLDLSSLAGDFLSEQLEQLTEQIPEEIEFLVGHLDDVIADVITELEPTLKAELIAATDDILDYLLRESPTLSVVISLESVKASVEEPLREAFMEYLPSGLAALFQSELDQLFDDFFGELVEMIPPTFELTEELIPADIPTQVAEALEGAEDGLADARQSLADGIAEAESTLEEDLPGIGISLKQIIGYFQAAYWGLLGFMALLILGIVLIHREVKGATRRIGITALTYGAIQFAGILIGKYFIEPMLTEKLLADRMQDIPVSLQDLPTQLLNSSTSPMQTLSLGILIGGVILIAVSFVYPRWRQASEQVDE